MQKLTSTLSGDTSVKLFTGLEIMISSFEGWLTIRSSFGELICEDCVVRPLPLLSTSTSMELGLAKLSIT